MTGIGASAIQEFENWISELEFPSKLRLKGLEVREKSGDSPL
jgi:hypothetical protein